MQYKCEHCGKVEVLWNSRDGVTPFGISCSLCVRGSMFHINWEEDKYEPKYIPIEGQRIFVDMPIEIKHVFVRKRIDKLWEHPDFPMREYYGNKDEAFEALSNGTEKTNEPWAIVWGVKK
jgi:hypothetical protein